MDTTIPRIIHYCWFGRNPLPKSARKCMASWRKFFPDYEIREWNEANFDVDSIPYTREAYRAGKYAFVSDYARFYVLYHHGGLYFDTDVEVVRPMDDIVGQGAFMGIEHGCGNIGVNPGLGIGAGARHAFYERVLDHYAGIHFADESGVQLPGTVVTHATELLVQSGFVVQDRQQDVAGIRIYPNEYFNPLDDATGRLTITGNTRSIHWYAKTWVDNYGPARKWMMRRLHRLFGVNAFSGLKRYIHI